MRPVSRLKFVVMVGLAAVLLAGCGTPESRRQKALQRGRAYAAEQNWEKARVEFRNAMQVSPTDPEARFESGYVAEKTGKPRDAVAFYQSALEVRPDYVEASLRLARLYLLAGAIEQAGATLKPALEKHPDDAGLLTIRAGVKSQQKDMPGALDDAERAFKLTPDSEDTIAVLAGLYKSSERIDDSIRLLEQGCARLPKSVDLRLALVQAYLAANRQDGAEGVLKQLVALQPDLPEHAVRLARFYAQTDRIDAAEATLRTAIKTTPASVPLKLALVQLVVERRGKDAAEAELKAQIGANPKTPELRFALAQLYGEEKSPDKVEQVLREVVQVEGKSQAGLQARGALARSRLQANDVPGAEKLVAEMLAVSPRETQALAIRADINMRKGDIKSAIADLRAVLRDQPKSLPFIRALAAAHVANNEALQAEEVLRRGVDAVPEDAALPLTLADLLMREGKLDEARSIAEKAHERAPADSVAIGALVRIQLLQRDFAAGHTTAASARTSLKNPAAGNYLDGLVYEAEGKPGPAFDSYSAAIDSMPEADDALNAYARLAVREKKNDQLRVKLQKVIVGSPKLAQPWEILGELNLGEKKYADARAAFNKAIELAPTRLAPYRGLSLTQSDSGDPDGAMATMRLAVEKVTAREDALFELAATGQRLKRTDEARKAYEDILAKHPANEPAANNLAMLLTELADPRSLDRARTLTAAFEKSSNPRYVDTYGWVLTVRGEYPAAIATLSKLVEAEPNVPAFRYHLALAQIKSGQVADGRTNLELALKGGDQFEGGAEARALLATIRKS